MAQARGVAEALPVPCELVAISTRGDRVAGALAEMGGKGLFTAELEARLRRGDVQLAVHSAKDVPAAMAEDLTIAAVPPREDPRDALISPAGLDLASLPKSARVATSSLRRAVQARATRPDLEITPVRGNVDTRIRKLRERRYDAVILAMAGLNRLDRTRQLAGMVRLLDVDRFVPAAGQGALAVQCLASDEQTRALVGRLSDPDSAAALWAEREIVRRLGATCRAAVGVHLWHCAGVWRGAAMAADPAGRKLIRPAAEAEALQQVLDELLAQLLGAGAEDLLAR